MSERPDFYVGDGVYASFNGYAIRLYTERASGTHEVFLDTVTLAHFEASVAMLRSQAAKDSSPASPSASDPRHSRRPCESAAG